MNVEFLKITNEITKLKTERCTLDNQIKTLRMRKKKLASLLFSSIFVDLLTHLDENIASLNWDYLGLDYCCEHKTHFPKCLPACLFCQINNSKYINLRDRSKLEKIPTMNGGISRHFMILRCQMLTLNTILKNIVSQIKIVCHLSARKI